ncbi:MAG TPA: RDD family protein, partial [Verrucomicrobiales bacterium]|nr:RDD family protein [Verrucomicrobiales bacterium]
MNGRTHTLTVQTPEGVVFAMRLAGPITRFLAWGVDVLFLWMLTNFIGFFGSLLGFISPDFATAISILMFFALTLSYGIALEWLWRGQTLGKKLLRLRVVDIEGMRLQFSQVVVRNLLRAVDSLPFFYVVGGITCLFSRHVQRL